MAVLASERSELFGYVVSNAGDVNGDGYEDLIVGTYHKLSGRAFVYFGGPTFDTIPDVILNARENILQFGESVSGAGDLNGDGYDDVLIGASLAPPSGKAYIFHGGDPMDTIPDLILRSNSDWGNFGSRISFLGDVNKDNYPALGVSETYWKDYTEIFER
jgi:hypothetical protein